MSAPKHRATISKAAKGEGRFIRHAGGRENYGHVILAIEPRKRGAGIEICNITSNNIPARFINAVVDAIEETLEVGIRNYGPIVDVIVRIADGSSHQTNSNELAFKLAAIAAVTPPWKKRVPFHLNEKHTSGHSIDHHSHQRKVLREPFRIPFSISGMIASANICHHRMYP